MSPQRIVAVCFDAGDTLIAYRRPIRILLQDFFIRHDEIVRRDAIAEALDAVDTRHRTLVAQVHTVEEEQRMWLELSRDFLDVLLPRRRDLYPALARSFTDWRNLKVFRDTTPTLRKLQVRGYRLAVISNWEPSLSATLDQLGLARYFETIVVSSVEGIWKPDPGLFEVALARLRVPAPQTLYVGDQIDRDALAARAVGMQALLLDRFDDHPQFSPRVRTLADLPAWLEDTQNHHPANS